MEKNEENETENKEEKKSVSRLLFLSTIPFQLRWGTVQQNESGSVSAYLIAAWLSTVTEYRAAQCNMDACTACYHVTWLAPRSGRFMLLSHRLADKI